MASNLTAQVRNIAEVVDRGGARRPVEEDHRRRQGGDPRAQEHHQHDGRSAAQRSPPRSPASPARSAPRASWAARRGSRGSRGTWKDLTDNVNWMASNLTDQVRGIARVVTAVAQGDLKRKVALEAKGEIAALAETINSMIDTLATFAEQVTTVAREVGIEGKLGGQARVPGASGTWRDLTDNVNQLADNLTTQVRAIAEVATAVTKGDLTRSITVQAQGEVAELKDNINQMIANLRETTQKNAEQDWLKTNLAKFTGMLQGQRDLNTVADLILTELAPLVGAYQGAFYLADEEALVPAAAAPPGQLRLLARPADHASPSARGWSASARSSASASSSPARRPTTSGCRPGWAERGRTRSRSCRSVSSSRSRRSSSWPTLQAVHRQPARLPRPPDRVDRHRAQHHRRLDAHRGAAQAVAGPDRGAAEDQRGAGQALASSCSSRRRRSSARTRRSSWPRRRSRSAPSSWRSPRATRASSWPTCRTSSGRRSTASSSWPASWPRTARATSATSRSSSPRPSTRAAPTSCCSSTTSSTCRRSSPAPWRSRSTRSSSARCSSSASAPSARWRRPTRSSSRSWRRPGCRDSIHTDPRRVQQVLKNLLSNAFKFTDVGRVILEVKPAQSGWNPQNQVLSQADQVIAFSVIDTGIGIPHRQAADHLRGLPAGRRQRQPALRRHRPRPVDQPRDRAPARRRPHGGEHAGARQPLHPVRAAGVRAGGAQPAGRAARSPWPGNGAVRRAAAGAGRRRCETEGLSAALMAPAVAQQLQDDRNELRTGDRVAAGHRQPAAAGARAGRDSCARAASRCWSRSAAATGCRWRAPTGRTPSRSTSTPRWSTAGPSSSGSSTTRAPATSRSCCSPGRRWIAREARCRGAFSLVRKPLDRGRARRARSTGWSASSTGRAASCSCARRTRPSGAPSQALLEGDDVEITTAATATECLSLLVADRASTAWCSTRRCRTCTGAACSTRSRRTRRSATRRSSSTAPQLGNGTSVAAWSAQLPAIKQVRAVEDLFAEASLLLHRRQEQPRSAPRQEVCSPRCRRSTRSWSATRCWWSTTTCATSSR